MNRPTANPFIPQSPLTDPPHRVRGASRACWVFSGSRGVDRKSVLISFIGFYWSDPDFSGGDKSPHLSDNCPLPSPTVVNSQNWAVSWTHNFARRNLNTAQKALVANSLRAHYDAEARKRQTEGQERGRQAQAGHSEKVVPGNISTNQPEPPRQKAREQVAKLVGISDRSADKARTGRRPNKLVLIGQIQIFRGDRSLKITKDFRLRAAPRARVEL